MIKIISSIAATALTVGGAGYSYVQKVQTETAEVRAENVRLVTKVETKNHAIDTASAALKTAADALAKARE
jgi:hypothetical protein